MDSFRIDEFQCPSCGYAGPMQVFESANIERDPHLRDELLQGTFMVQGCPGCGEPCVVEMDMLLYIDLDRRQFFACFQRGRRAAAGAQPPQVDEAIHRALVRDARSADLVGKRIVFGYEELREKVFCYQAGLDDRLLEALKLQVLLAPGSDDIRALSLRTVSADGLHFASLEPGGIGEVAIPRANYDRLVGDRVYVASMLPALFASHYVHVERCLPAPG